MIPSSIEYIDIHNISIYCPVVEDLPMSLLGVYSLKDMGNIA
jgi:hypothetical protein